MARLNPERLDALLGAPTLGAIRRRNGITDDEAQRKTGWLLACTMVTEAQRFDCLDELASITRFASNGAPLCAMARRLRQLANRLHDPAPDEPAPAVLVGATRAVVELLASAGVDAETAA